MPEEKSINLTKSISPINFTNLSLINLRSYSKVTSENALVDQSVREVISNKRLGTQDKPKAKKHKAANELQIKFMGLQAG